MNIQNLTILVLLVCVILVISLIYLYCFFLKYKKHSKEYNMWKDVLYKSDDSWIFIPKDMQIIKGYGKLFQDINNEFEKVTRYHDFLSLFHPSKSMILHSKISAIFNNDKNCEENFKMTIPLAHDSNSIYHIKGMLRHNQVLLYLKNNSEAVRNVALSSKILKSFMDTKNELVKLINTFDFPIWIRSIDAKLLQCNDKYAKIFNKTKEDIIKNNIHIWQDYLDINNSKESKNTILNLQKCEKRVLLPHGSELYKFEEFKNNHVIIGYAYSIEHRNNIESQVASQHNLITNILHTTSSGTAIFDDNKQLKFFNREYADIFEFDQDWLKKKPYLHELLSDLHSRGISPKDKSYQQHLDEEIDVFDKLSKKQEWYESFNNGRRLHMVKLPYLNGMLLIVNKISTKKPDIIQPQKLLNLVQSGIMVIDEEFRIKFTNKIMENILNINDLQGMTLNNLKLDSINNFYDQNHNNNNLVINKLIKLTTNGGSIVLKLNNDKFYQVKYFYETNHILLFEDISIFHRIQKHTELNSNNISSKLTKLNNGGHLLDKFSTIFLKLFSNLYTLENLGNLSSKLDVLNFLETAVKLIQFQNDQKLLQTGQGGKSVLNCVHYKPLTLFQILISDFEKMFYFNNKPDFILEYQKTMDNLVIDYDIFKMLFFNICSIINSDNNISKIKIKEVGNSFEIIAKPWSNKITSINTYNTGLFTSLQMAATAENKIHDIASLKNLILKEENNNYKNIFISNLNQFESIQKLHLIESILHLQGGKLQIFCNDKEYTNISNFYKECIANSEYNNDMDHAKAMENKNADFTQKQNAAPSHTINPFTNISEIRCVLSRSMNIHSSHSSEDEESHVS